MSGSDSEVLQAERRPDMERAPVGIRVRSCRRASRTALFFGSGGRLGRMTLFSAAEGTWVERLGGLRSLVRQESIARQIECHVPSRHTVLDVGCGQGTQAIRLAERGCTVVGVDPSTALLEQLRAAAHAGGLQVQTCVGSLEDLPVLLDDRRFEVVCAHGLLMYLEDTAAALAMLASYTTPDGLLSVTFRNGAALAYRPALRGQWRAATEALRTKTYVNELGVTATAHTLENITGCLTELGFAVVQWYGVRVFTDPMPADQPPPPEPDLRRLLDVEYEASRRDPYRHFGSQIHVVAQRTS